MNSRNLSFSLLNVDDNHDYGTANYFLNLQKDSHNQHDSNINFYKFELIMGSESPLVAYESVGNCNGLACVKRASQPDEEITVINPFRRETLALVTEIGGGGGGGSLEHLCQGFGFDSSAQEYKVILIYTTSTTAGDQGFICKVVTLGDASWREVVTRTSEISPPPGCSPFPSRMVTRIWKNTHKSATIVGVIFYGG